MHSANFFEQLDDVLCAFESKHALPFYSELSRSSVRLLPVTKPRWRERERRIEREGERDR